MPLSSCSGEPDTDSMVYRLLEERASVHYWIPASLPTINEYLLPKGKTYPTEPLLTEGREKFFLVSPHLKGQPVSPSTSRINLRDS